MSSRGKKGRPRKESSNFSPPTEPLALAAARKGSRSSSSEQKTSQRKKRKKKKEKKEINRSTCRIGSEPTYDRGRGNYYGLFAGEAKRVAGKATAGAAGGQFFWCCGTSCRGKEEVFQLHSHVECTPSSSFLSCA